MRVLRNFDDLTPVPWANGAGETTELISLTESETITPGRRPWRLSVARLERTGPFSSLPGMARTFLPVGAEVTLEIDGQVQRVLQTEPARFTGDQDVALVDLPVPCFALNLMVAEDHGSGSGRPTVEMVVDPDQGFHEWERFAVTLEATAEHPRFRLIHLGEGETLPAGRVAYLR
ncbi:HutD family protein [Brevibacterium sp.]|uniref:HutD family protein n=1 Tax=Brevibacterium sp. TaxID=1701 RepID=UPI0028127149|nr:HutD family protein [Brevibacterium sp.]